MTPTHPDRANAPHMIEVLDRLLDRGIVIDAEINVSLVGLRFVDVEARIVVACIETYLEYAEAIGDAAPASWSGPGRDEGLPDHPPEVDVAFMNRIGPFLRDESRSGDDPAEWSNE